MTRKQHAYMFGKGGLWQSACEAQGWEPKDRDKRLDVFAEALGKRVSFSALNNAEFGRVKATLERYANSLKGADKECYPERCDAPAIRHKILGEVIPCLAVYVEDPIGYADTILIKEFKTRNFDNLSEYRQQPKNPKKQPSSPLERFFWTLNARLHAMRRKADHSIEDMQEKAGLRPAEV